MQHLSAIYFLSLCLYFGIPNSHHRYNLVNVAVGKLAILACFTWEELRQAHQSRTLCSRFKPVWEGSRGCVTSMVRTKKIMNINEVDVVAAAAARALANEGESSSPRRSGSTTSWRWWWPCGRHICLAVYRSEFESNFCVKWLEKHDERKCKKNVSLTYFER